MNLRILRNLKEIGINNLGNNVQHFVIAVLMMIAVTLTLVSSTYARYTATISRNGTATVAKWAFTADNSGSTTMNVSFADTYHASTLVAGKIAPGTKGSFDISVSNASSEVGVEYTVTLGTIANAPTNIKFYSDATYATPLTTSTPITGKIKANDSTAKIVKIYWAWPYQTGAVTPATGVAAGDTADTADGVAAKTLTVPVTITGVQTQPSATAIP